jgi:Fe-S-cluster containining protein
MQHATVAKAKKRKDQVCMKCKAPCCQNLAIAVTKPRRIHEKELLKWYLHYDTVQIYIRNRRWYLLITGTCIYLSKKNLCTIYDKRPQICRAHRPDGCEITGQWYDTLLSSPRDLETFLKRGKLKRARRRPRAT